MADIPGLIEGAHQGVGLGDEFLRHIERTRLLLHVLDVSGIEGRDPLEDFRIINGELAGYSPKLTGRPQIVVLNKIDLTPAQEKLPEVRKKLENEGYEVFAISAVTGKGVKKLMYRVAELLDELPEEEIKPREESVLIKPDFVEEERITVKEVSAKHYEMTGRLVEENVQKTDFSNEEAVKRMLRVLKHHGLNDILKKAGVQEGDTVLIGPMEFDYLE